MNQQVIINHVTIDATNFYQEMVTNNTGKDIIKIGLDFKVKSADYHEITTLLYANDFHVKVPVKGLEFQATIHTYSTSITNLYEKDNVGDFKLELIEKV